MIERAVKKNCRDPGLNQGPSDLQSDALPTELSRRYFVRDKNVEASVLLSVTSGVAVTVENCSKRKRFIAPLVA